MRQYARLLQKLGYPVRLTNVKLMTQSAIHTLKSFVDYGKLLELGYSYEPCLFHAPILQRRGLSFIVYQSGKVIVTGLKTSKDYDNALAAILDIELVLH